jgi:predicted nucleic acid-binding protein
MSGAVVVDASLALKWVIREEDSSAAQALLSKWDRDGTDILAPGLFAYETANILYRRVVTNKLSYDDAVVLLKKLYSINILLDFSSYKDVSLRAVYFAHRFGLSAAYDAHYLALAEREQCEIWTADARFLRAINGKLPWVHSLADYQSAS